MMSCFEVTSEVEVSQLLLGTQRMKVTLMTTSLGRK